MDNSKIILSLNENICCDPSLEPSRQDCSNGGSQDTFYRSNMENYPLIIPFTPSYLENCLIFPVTPSFSEQIFHGPVCSFLTNDKLATKTLTVTVLCIVVNNVSKF